MRKAILAIGDFIYLKREGGLRKGLVIFLAIYAFWNLFGMVFALFALGLVIGPFVMAECVVVWTFFLAGNNWLAIRQKLMPRQAVQNPDTKVRA